MTEDSERVRAGFDFALTGIVIDGPSLAARWKVKLYI